MSCEQEIGGAPDKASVSVRGQRILGALLPAGLRDLASGGASVLVTGNLGSPGWPLGQHD